MGPPLESISPPLLVENIVGDVLFGRVLLVMSSKCAPCMDTTKGEREMVLGECLPFVVVGVF
jgi:hypothetical protein